MRKQFTKIALAAALGLALALTSCGKGGGDVKLLESITDGDGKPLKKFEYDKQNRLIKIIDYYEGNIYYTGTITYSGNSSVIVERVYDKSKEKKVENFVISGNTIKRESADFLTINEDGYITVEVGSWRFQYQNGNLISQESETGGYSYTSYDDKKSPFSSASTPKWLLQYVLEDFTSANKNNILEENSGGEVTASANYKYKYEYNSDGFPAKKETYAEYAESKEKSITLYTYSGDSSKDNASAPQQQPAAKPDTLYITETSYVQIWITSDDYVDETGDGSFYMGNALGKVEELGIKGVSVDKDSYVSFALAGGKQHIINSNDNRYAILLYKKGQKPIYLDLGSEIPITDDVYKYLGIINPLEDAIIRIVKAIQNKDEKALNGFIPQDGVTLMHYPVGMMPAYDNFSKISFDEQTPDALVLGSIDITDFKVHFEELPSYDCDKEQWNKIGIYASTTEEKNYSIMVVGKEGSFEEFFLNFRDGKWWLSTIYRPDLCGA